MARRKRGLGNNHSRRKNKLRHHMIDLARLLGYTIEPYKEDFGSGTKYRAMNYMLRDPLGELVVKPIEPMRTSYGYSYIQPEPKKFPFMWRAAEHALELAGVDVSKISVPREDGTGAGSS